MARTYRDLVYTVFDELKIVSDDSVWEVDHVVDMLNKYRALLFEQKYKGKWSEIPPQFLQELNVQLSPNSTFNNIVVKKSTIKIPDILNLSNSNIFSYAKSSSNRFGDVISVVPSIRFESIGYGKYSNKLKYVTVYKDSYAYTKGITDNSFKLITVLDNPIDIVSFNNMQITNTLDIQFPCEESLIQPIIRLCVDELGKANSIPSDMYNNGVDDHNIISSNGKQQ